MKAILELQGLGAVVEVEENRPPEAALASLDEFQEQTPMVDLPAGAIPPALLLKDALMSLDGAASEESTIDREAPTRSGSPNSDEPTTNAATNPMALMTLDGSAEVSVTDPFVSRTEPSIRPPDPGALNSEQITNVVEPSESTSPTNPEERFKPPSLDSAAMQIDIDVALPRPATNLPPEAMEAEEIRMCEEHELPEPCQACADAEAPVPGRIMQGALRKKPLVRVAVGLGLGLLVGYLASMPYADRAQKRVGLVRAEADQTRFKNALELQEQTARLDAQAESMSNSAAFGTIAIWLVVGGAVVGGWYRAT